MRESVFNEDQEDYMRSLAARGPENLCWCGWNPLGKCPNCKTEKSAADKLRLRCESCGATPGHDEDPASMIHRRACALAARGGAD